MIAQSLDGEIVCAFSSKSYILLLRVDIWLACDMQTYFANKKHRHVRTQ